MELEQLKEYYNRIDRCSLSLIKEPDFDYIQTQIAKIAVHTEDMNRIIGELLVEKTKLEHKLTDIQFDFELKYTNHMMTNPDVKKIATGKERRDYINYFLLKDDFKKIGGMELEIKDIESLLIFSKKKAKDLDKLFPKLQTLWESIQSELKYIKKMGSDSQYLEKVRNEISKDQSMSKPVFTDEIVEQIQVEQYEPDKQESLFLDNKEEDVEKELNLLLGDL